MTKNKIRVAIVVLGFGAEFIPIYQKHPNAEIMAICQRNRIKLDEIGDAFGIKKRYTDYDGASKGLANRCRTYQHPRYPTTPSNPLQH